MIDKNDELLLKNISEINGISGFENEVAAYIKEQIKDDVDEISFDNLGSLIAYQKGNKDQPLVMFCAHMDEVGFVVKNIEESGLIRIHNVGGWYNHIILNQMYVIKTRDNKKYFAISGAQPPHGMSKEAASKVLDLKDTQFVLARDMIISSNFQSVIVGFLCEYENAKSFEDGTWIELIGTITKGDYHGDMPIINVTKIDKIEKPSEEYVYPPDENYIPTSLGV